MSRIAPSGRFHLGAENSFKVAPKFRERGARAGVERVGLEFNTLGAAVEGVAEQQELRGGIDRRALRFGRIPGAADLDAVMLGADGQITGLADQTPVRRDHRMRNPASRFLFIAQPIKPRAETALGDRERHARKDRQVRFRRRRQSLAVALLERLQPHVRVRQYPSGKVHADCPRNEGALACSL